MAEVGSRRAADARVDQPIAEIDQKIDHQDDGREQHDQVLNHDQVAVADRLEEQPTQAGQNEDVFDDDGAHQEPGELNAQDGYYRDGRVAETMFVEGLPSGETFVARRSENIFALDVDDCRAAVPGTPRVLAPPEPQ